MKHLSLQDIERLLKDATDGPWINNRTKHYGAVYANHPNRKSIKEAHLVAKCFADKNMCPDSGIQCELQAIQINNAAANQVIANASIIAAAPTLARQLIDVMTERDAMVIAMQALLYSAKGVVPNSADRFYNARLGRFEPKDQYNDG